MALKQNFSINRKANVSENGLTANADVSVSENLYVKVSSVQTAKQGETAFIGVADVSFSGETITGNKTYSFEYNLSGENAIAQAYDHLKTLPEFADAIDC